MALLVTRGNDPVNGKLEDPGALKIYNYQKGVLTEQSSIAPNEGYGFGPRHLDIHADLPWVFVSLERQNKLYAFRTDEHDRIATEAAFKRETLADPDTVRPRQMAGAIHVHPNGRYLYLANRALGLTEYQGKKISADGETGNRRLFDRSSHRRADQDSEHRLARRASANFCHRSDRTNFGRCQLDAAGHEK
ncbi:MAG: beta-propeller fold lactonase family protein [Pseudolabrys sp.]